MKTNQLIKLGRETNWYTAIKGRRINAVNCVSRLFEETSPTEGMTMNLFPKDTDPNDVADALGHFLWIGKDYEYALYDTQNRLVGWAYYPEARSALI